MTEEIVESGQHAASTTPFHQEDSGTPRSLSPEPSRQPSEATLHVQLTQLNEKVRVYVSRLWQLPFVYLTVTGLFYVQVRQSNHATTSVSALLILLGMLSVWSTVHIERRINQTVADIAKIEECLGLERTVVVWNLPMMLPYYAMIAIGIVANGLVLL